MTERETTVPVDAFIRQSHRPINRWEQERKVYEEEHQLESAVDRFKRTAVRKQMAREIAAREVKP